MTEKGNSKSTASSFLTADHQLRLAYTMKAKPTGRELGSGTYGTVIELISAGEIVAGKVFKTSSTIDHQVINKLCGELSLLAQVHHPNIVQCKGVCSHISTTTADSHPGSNTFGHWYDLIP